MSGPVALSSLLLLALTGGCASTRTANPSFPVTVVEARAALQEMAAEPKPLERPVVVLGGFLDPISCNYLRDRLRRLASDDTQFIGVSFTFSGSFSSCREKVIAAVDAALPSDDPNETVEVDVIGVSMGGVVARYAAMPIAGERRLKIRRLFTISSPHRGASMAFLPALHPLHRGMRSDSRLIRQLEDSVAEIEYELVAYVRLGDEMVGVDNAAPEGLEVWWLSNRPLSSPHGGAFRDPRILADIARQLRDEPTFRRAPAEALP